MNEGFVYVWRKIRDKGYYRKSTYVHLWLHLLLLASYKEKEFLWNGKITKLKAGEFVTGRKSLSTETGIPESTIEDILKVFEMEQQIRQQKTNKFRLITILNWQGYQKSDSNSDNKATTKQQQTDTINKGNKEDKGNKEYIAAPQTSPPFVWSEYLKGMDDNPRIDIQLIGYYFQRRKLKFDSKAEAEIAIRRHLRAARDVSKFGKAKVFKAMDECDQLEKQKGIKWSLETTLKMLTK